jgi:hypothetical protein
VTHGAGGSSRDDRTVRLVERIGRETGLLPMAHLTCRDSTVDDLLAEIREYQAVGIENVLALRGDPPNGEGRFVAHEGGLRYGSELARLLADNADLCVGAACSPEKHVESASLEADVAAAIQKVEAGAAFLITQLFFDNSVHFDFVSRRRTGRSLHQAEPVSGDARHPQRPAHRPTLPVESLIPNGDYPMALRPDRQGDVAQVLDSDLLPIPMSMLYPPPVVSPDGRFYWTGTSWMPLPVPVAGSHIEVAAFGQVGRPNGVENLHVV